MRGKAQHSRFLLIEAVEPRGLHHHADFHVNVLEFRELKIATEGRHGEI